MPKRKIEELKENPKFAVQCVDQSEWNAMLNAIESVSSVKNYAAGIPTQFNQYSNCIAINKNDCTIYGSERWFVMHMAYLLVPASDFIEDKPVSEVSQQLNNLGDYGHVSLPTNVVRDTAITFARWLEQHTEKLTDNTYITNYAGDCKVRTIEQVYDDLFTQKNQEK